MKRVYKYIVLAVLIAAMLVTACACSSNNQVTRPVPDVDENGKTVEVYEITGEAVLKKIDDTTLRLSCTTNIMEGTVIVMSIDSYEGEVLEKKVYNMIDGDNIYADFEIKSKWNGPITGAVSVTPEEDGKQPDAVKEAYGAKLQNIKGDSGLFSSTGNMICIQSEALTDY